MRILVCHVRYGQSGGEDVVYRAEVGLLREAGHDVQTLELASRDLRAVPLPQRARIALNYSDHAWGRSLLRSALQRQWADVVHFHNIYPQLGPGAILEADRHGCATLQTLHNYRLSCLTGRYVRADDACTSCGPRSFRAGVLHGCYRGSRAQSLLVARATTAQWHNFVQRRTPLFWLTLTPEMRQFYVRLGAPEDRVVVKANSVEAGARAGRGGRSGVFLGGRLSPEKGVVPFMRAWPDDAPMLTVAGDGPMAEDVRRAVKQNVRFLGHLTTEAMRSALREALVVAMPSVWPEPVSLVALEAFAEGTPVVAFEGSSLGWAARELSPRCVVSFGDFPALARRAVELASTADWDGLSGRAVDIWSARYSHPVNQRALLSIYEAAVALKHGATAA